MVRGLRCQALVMWPDLRASTSVWNSPSLWTARGGLGIEEPSPQTTIVCRGKAQRWGHGIGTAFGGGGNVQLGHPQPKTFTAAFSPLCRGSLCRETPNLTEQTSCEAKVDALGSAERIPCTGSELHSPLTHRRRQTVTAGATAMGGGEQCLPCHTA